MLCVNFSRAAMFHSHFHLTLRPLFVTRRFTECNANGHEHKVRMVEATFVKGYLIDRCAVEAADRDDLKKSVLNQVVRKLLETSVTMQQVESGDVDTICLPINIRNFHWALLLLSITHAEMGDENALHKGSLRYIDTFGTAAAVKGRLDLSPQGSVISGVVEIAKKYLGVEVCPEVEYVQTGWNQRENECALVVNEMVRRTILGVEYTAPLSRFVRVTQTIQLLRCATILPGEAAS